MSLEPSRSSVLNSRIIRFGSQADNTPHERRSKLIPTLFLHYDLELVEPEKEWETNCWWFVMQKGLNVCLKPRESST